MRHCENKESSPRTQRNDLAWPGLAPRLLNQESGVLNIRPSCLPWKAFMVNQNITRTKIILLYYSMLTKCTVWQKVWNCLQCFENNDYFLPSFGTYKKLHFMTPLYCKMINTGTQFPRGLHYSSPYTYIFICSLVRSN